MAATALPTPAAHGLAGALRRARSEPAYGAFLILWVGFTVLPLVMGLDKFADVLTRWEGYLAPWVVGLLPFSAHTAMLGGRRRRDRRWRHGRPLEAGSRGLRGRALAGGASSSTS